MGHMDFSHHAHEASSSYLSSVSMHGIVNEVGASTTAPGDFTDSHLPNWEAAWIDIGGEG